MTIFTKFLQFDKYGRRTEYLVTQAELKTFKIVMLEKYIAGQIENIYIFENNEWRLLDYYNDV